MPATAVVLALLTTVANAAALVLQRKAARDVAGSLREVARQPAWVLGMAVFACAIALQATALSLGSIALVQPVVVMALPFTLLVGWVVLGGALGGREWLAVAAIAVGLVVLLTSLRPGGGDALGASATVWAVGSAVTLGLLGLLCLLAARHDGALRAALFGVAAGAGSGFVAVIVKAMAEALSRGGLAAVLSTPQTYLLVPTAPLAFLALQHALHAGRLLASQPGLVLGNPLTASCWGVVLLGEQVRGGIAIVGAVAGGMVLAAGVLVLAGSPLLAAQDAGARRPERSAGSRARAA